MKVSSTKTKMKKIGLKKSIKNKPVFKSSKVKKIKKSKETFKENGNTHKLASKKKSGLQNKGEREPHITQTKQRTSLDDTDSELEELLDESEDEPNTHNNLFQNQSENESDKDAGENYDDEVEAHKKSLAKLKEVDPEFYKFLQENDQKLLKFNVSDDEEDEDDDNVTDDVHKPDEDDLQVASDESDFEPEEDEASGGKKGKVTLKMLKKWQAKLQTDKSNKTIGCVIKAFHAAMLRVSAQNDESPEYKVEGSSVFNAVIQLCVLELGPAVRRFLGISRSKQPPHKCKRFVKIKSLLKSYFTDLLKLLGGVTSSNILTVLLKHMHYMSSMMVSFPNLAKPTIKRLVNLWGTGDETVRVVAFLCIVRIVGNRQTGLLDTTLKSMHMTYVKNSKFVSISSLPAINFMRRSLVEMFALDLNVAYQHVFLYVRQLAIHLRNAITMHKKEHIQAVYNWQFVNSLKLWGNLLEVTYNDRSQLQPLLYPLVQVCLGTIKLIPTAQYYPLRFHIVQILMDISRETGVFIPILPFLTEILQSYNFNKKHTKVSMKPVQFTCILRLSKSQLQENGFKDALVESIYAQLLEYLSNQSNSIAFPDLSLLCVIQIKKFLKTCRVTNYCKKMRQILEKIQQNGEFIERERRNVTFALTDLKQIEGWQTTIKNKGTPLSIYYDNWNKIRTVKRNKQATENDKIGDYNLPTLKKTRKEKKENDENDSKGAPNPFPSDSESDTEFNFGGNSDEDDDEDKEKAKDKRKAKDGEHKKTRGSRGGKKLKNKEIRTNNEHEDSNFAATDDVEDVIEDIKLSEW